MSCKRVLCKKQRPDFLNLDFSSNSQEYVVAATYSFVLDEKSMFKKSGLYFGARAVDQLGTYKKVSKNCHFCQKSSFLKVFD